MKIKNFFFVFFILFTSTICIAQKSYLVQIKKGESLYNFNRSNSNNFQVRQVCSIPMNIWEVSADRISERSIIDYFSKTATIVSINENRKISLRTNPNDTLYKSQWQYKNLGGSGGKIGADINAEEAWEITTGGKTANGDDIVVAVVDDGLDISHEDIVENLWINKGEIDGDGIDNDGNGYIDDIHGWNVPDQNGKVNIGGGHGSSVSGIVGAKGNNKIGVTGVNWDVKLMTIDYGTGTEANAVASYAYAYTMRKLYNESNGQKGAFVVATNSSWGVDTGMPDDAPLWCAFYDSLGSIGILSMGATANRNFDIDVVGDLPTACSSEYLISVTNLGRNDVKITSAGYGKKTIDIGAYGEATYNIRVGDKYGSFGGTSGATPHVAGAAALLYSVKCNNFGDVIKTNPSKSALIVKDLILSNTTPNQSIESTSTTGGRLNLGKATKALLNRCSDCQQPAGITSSFEDFTTLKLTWDGNAKGQIRYKKEDASEWIVKDFSSSNLTIEGLEYCTPYLYQIRYTCDTITSEWGYRKYINSGGCCDVPTAPIVHYKNNQIEIKIDSTKETIISYKSSDASTWTDLSVKNSGGSVLIAAMEECKLIEIRSSTYCEIQNKFSDYSSIVSIPTKCGECTSENYCEAKALDNDIEWIDSVGLGNDIIYTGRNDKGYDNNIGLIISKVKQGDSTFLKVIPGFSGNSFSENFTVYVDFNQNGAFDTLELLSSAKASRTGISKNVFIPEDALPGITRMRVIMSFRELSPACDYTTQYGEVEDYCIEIERSVAVKDLSKDNFSITPNPSQGKITVDWPSNFQPRTLLVTNSIGQTMISLKINNASESVNLDLENGVYQISLLSANEIRSKKVVINK